MLFELFSGPAHSSGNMVIVHLSSFRMGTIYYNLKARLCTRREIVRLTEICPQAKGEFFINEVFADRGIEPETVAVYPNDCV